MADNRQIIALYTELAENPTKDFGCEKGLDNAKAHRYKAVKIPSEVRREQHWDSIFQNADYTQVLWHQNSPEQSLNLIEKYTSKESSIIDVGCGASYLVDHLLDQHYRDITLLDTSKTSLALVEKRIDTQDVTFICADLLQFQTQKAFALWHDRAVFHFLLSQKERQKYFEVLMRTLQSNGIAILSTFRVDGPIQCAGLDIIQYDHQKMLGELPEGLELIESEEYTHITPKQSEQAYIYFVIRKQ